MNLPSKAVRRNALRRAEKRRDIAVSERFAITGEPEDTMPDAPLGWRFVYGLVQVVIAAVIVALGYFLYNAIIASAPTADRKPPTRVARLVDVIPATPATQGPIIEAWGEVIAAQTLIVRPEISGTIAWVHDEITPGGRIDAGTIAARFDDIDLKLAVGQAETTIAGIDARILIEEGQAEIGKRELSRLSRNLTEAQRDLVLRKPQMAQLQAERQAALASREQAANALARAEVIVPFDAIVLSESVAPGAMLAQGAEVATLVAADRFHIKMAVPATSLEWIDFEAGQDVTVTQEGTWPDGASRTGAILRLSSALSETGRMAEVIVEVQNPLGATPPLLLGSFVKGLIQGTAIEDSVRLDRAHLRDGDTVWIMDTEDKLEVRPVQVVWRGHESVLVNGGLADGDRIVTTALATFAPGMALRTRDEAANE